MNLFYCFCFALIHYICLNLTFSVLKKNEFQTPVAVVVHSLSRVQLFVPPWTAACQASLFTISQSLLKLMSIESAIPSNHLFLCRPLSSCLQSFPESGFLLMSQLFASGGQSIGASASPSVFTVNIQGWFPLGLRLQGTLKSLLQHHSSKASILWCLTFFMVQLSHPYMTTGKSIALTIQTFVGKVTSLLFNTLSRLVIAFLPRSKHL